jgi:hypothetical protein
MPTSLQSYSFFFPGLELFRLNSDQASACPDDLDGYAFISFANFILTPAVN